MQNFIIIGIIVFVAVIGIIYTIKHYKGEGDSCGGNSYKPKR